ncbi:MAG: hypothetical protein B5M48_00665 [Candidatus Omnitrophica bacterium 4484_213]|nr:MAG: hypothetical protein B5M48_00665 [Candidatus Omnitrophica bacterium 4484_213]
MKIETYSFGLMTIDSKVYNRDLIIFPERVRTNWWRREGQCLAIEDLKEVIDYKPEVLIVGTGAYGAVDIPKCTKKVLKDKQIELIEKNISQAYQIFNEYIEKGKKAVGAFHLTC